MTKEPGTFERFSTNAAPLSSAIRSAVPWPVAVKITEYPWVFRSSIHEFRSSSRPEKLGRS